MATVGQHRHPAGEALYDLITALLLARHRLRHADRLGVADVVGGRWGVMRSLVMDGPQTVARLAASRPVSRGTIQGIVTGLEADGLVMLTDNPGRRRGRVVQPTIYGERWFAGIEEKLVGAIDELALGFNPNALADAARVVGALNERLLESVEDGQKDDTGAG